jgi:hypothetical protein
MGLTVGWFAIARRWVVGRRSAATHKEAAALERAQGGRKGVTSCGLAGPLGLHRPTGPNAMRRTASEFKLDFGICQGFEKLHKEI